MVFNNAIGRWPNGLVRPSEESDRKGVVEACFVVTDGDDQKLAFIYHREEPGQRAAAKLPTKEQARQIAANIARLPKVLRKEWRAALATSYLYLTGV